MQYCKTKAHCHGLFTPLIVLWLKFIVTGDAPGTAYTILAGVFSEIQSVDTGLVIEFIQIKPLLAFTSLICFLRQNPGLTTLTVSQKMECHISFANQCCHIDDKDSFLAPRLLVSCLYPSLSFAKTFIVPRVYSNPYYSWQAADHHIKLSH